MVNLTPYHKRTGYIRDGTMDNKQVFQDMNYIFEQAKNYQELITAKRTFLTNTLGIDSTFYGFILNPNMAFLSEKQRILITQRTQGSYRYEDKPSIGAVVDSIKYKSNHPKAWQDAIVHNPFLFECASYYELIQSKKHLWLDIPKVNLLPDGKAKKNERELLDRLGGCRMYTGVSLLNSGSSKHYIPSCLGARSSLVNAVDFTKLWLENEPLVCSVLHRFDDIMRRYHLAGFLGITKKEIETLDHANIPQKGIEFILDRETCTIERRAKTIKEKLCSPSLQAAAIVAAKLGI
ncbi:MAG: hypothetical protein ACJAXJ_004064 [Colwellia sp.]|jgi:hypothetical protein